MQEPMDMLTDQVAQSAERLKQHYGARRLHILRVGVRRIRTYLKQSGNHRDINPQHHHSLRQCEFYPVTIGPNIPTLHQTL